MRRILLLCIFALACNLFAAVAQSQAELPAACDLENRHPQRRFYQRGNAPDDHKDDDWPTSTLSQQGIDPVIVAAGLARLGGIPNQAVADLLCAMGILWYEQYFNGSHVSDSNNIASVSKSILSALFGIAFDQGDLLEPWKIEWPTICPSTSTMLSRIRVC